MIATCSTPRVTVRCRHRQSASNNYSTSNIWSCARPPTRTYVSFIRSCKRPPRTTAAVDSGCPVWPRRSTARLKGFGSYAQEGHASTFRIPRRTITPVEPASAWTLPVVTESDYRDRGARPELHTPRAKRRSSRPSAGRTPGHRSAPPAISRASHAGRANRDRAPASCSGRPTVIKEPPGRCGPVVRMDRDLRLDGGREPMFACLSHGS